MTKGEHSRASAATKAYSDQANQRRIGMFIDLAAEILRWRSRDADEDEDQGRRYPSERHLRDYLRSRDWKTARGGEVSIRTVQEVMESMTHGSDVFPAPNADFAAKNANVALPGTEIATVVITPDEWAEFCEEIRDGWKPSWRARTLTDDNDEALNARLKFLLSRFPAPQ